MVKLLIDYSNPFSTRYVRPGAITYHLPDALSIDQLVARLKSHDWWGQVVGRHGAGKTTLLHTLLPAIEQAGRRVQFLTLHAGQRRLQIPKSVSNQWDASTQLVIDGYEQLSWLARMQVKHRCRSQLAGLLVTTHRPLGLPTLLKVEPTCELVARLVLDLTKETPGLVDELDVRRCFERQAGNVREAFFALYDLCEQRRSSPA
jgi:hypothetical protein